MNFVISVPRSLTLSLFYILVVVQAIAKEETITMDKTCSKKDRGFQLHKDNSYILQWNGSDPGPKGCTYFFYESKNLKTFTEGHSICVVSEKFYLDSPGIYLKFYDVHNRHTQKVYTFNDTIRKFCSESFLDIKIYTDKRDGSTERVNITGSYFVLKVTATWRQDVRERSTGKANNNNKILIYLLGVITAVGVCSFVLKAVSRLIRRTRRERCDSEFESHEEEPTHEQSVQRIRHPPDKPGTGDTRNTRYTGTENPGYTPIELTYPGLYDQDQTSDTLSERDLSLYDDTVKLTA